MQTDTTVEAQAAANAAANAAAARAAAQHAAAARAAAAALNERVRKVAVLLGGTSGERPISLASGKNVADVLTAEGFEVARIDPAEPDWIDALQAFAPDVAFLALHGQGGEDGTMQGLLDLLAIPYTHSGVLASALAMDKERSKVHYRAEGLSVPRSQRVWRGETLDGEALARSFGLPCVVKPVRDGSSLGVSIPQTLDELSRALDAAFAVGAEVMVEEFIAGVEVTVPVVGNAGSVVVVAAGDAATDAASWALPVIEIIPANEFYDYESKYAEGGSEHIIPARISPEQTLACQQAALRAHEALGCRGVSRTDLIISLTGVPHVIETNTIPGMTGTSLVPESARTLGLEPGVFYRYLLALALD